MITLEGHSDDCVDLEGDIREQLTPYDDEKGMYVAFSDGTLVHIKYGLEAGDPDGWTIKVLVRGNVSTVLHEPALMRNGNQYSDLLTIDDDIKWVMAGETFHRSYK